MQKIRYLTLSLIAAGILSACTTVPPKNSTLSDARSSYNSARSNPQVTQLAPLELKDAGETLEKADAALTKGEDEARVNQLAYLAKQKVAIAQETARRKQADLDVASSSAKRDQVRLDARTAEADAAKKRAELAQRTADQRAQALAAASAQSQRDQALIAARLAELEEAKKQAEIAQQASDQQAAALMEARLQAERDQAQINARRAEIEAANARAQQSQARIDEQQAQLKALQARQAEAEAEAARQEAARAQAAEQRAKALADAKAEAERAQALVAEQDKQLKELNAKKTDRGMVITLGDVLFNVNKAALSSGGIVNVKKLAEFLKAYPQRTVVIEGHTDNRGSDSYNQALSERRAEAVQKTLVDLGIGSDRIATRGFGESTPVANNETAAGRQLNRRVEIVLPDEGSAPKQ